MPAPGLRIPLERTLKHSHMERATLDAMFGAIDEYLPKFWQYLKVKAKALGHENGLPWYDLFAPMGKASSTFTTEQARDYLVDLFSHFDSELSEMVQTPLTTPGSTSIPAAARPAAPSAPG